MDATELLAVVRRQPFQPFTLRMNDGREYRIAHPEWIVVTRRLVTVVSAQDGTTTYLEPLLIASLHFPPPPAPPPSPQGPTQA